MEPQEAKYLDLEQRENYGTSRKRASGVSYLKAEPEAKN